MYQHQDWDVVVLRKHNKARPIDAPTETKPKQKAPSTLVSIKKLDDNQEVFHHKLVSKEVANEIMKTRIEKKLTQADLARSINEQTAVIQEIETGKAIYNPNVLNKIHRVLGIQKKQKRLQ